MTGTGVRGALLVVCNLLGLAAFLWPFALPAAVGGERAHGIDAPLVVAGLLGCLGALLFLELGRGGMGPKAVALIGVLGAAMVALRLPGFIAGFSAMFIVVLVAGNAFGPAFGFVLGAVGTFASGLFVGGLGPWLPFQMVAVGWVGAGAGLVPRRGRWPLRIGALAAYGVIAGYLFGGVMNLWFWPFTTQGSAVGWEPALGMVENLRRYGAFYLATSFGWDTARAVGNAMLVVVLARPLLGALDRAARRMHVEVGGRIIVRQSEEPAGWPRPPRETARGRGKSGLHRAGRWGKSQAGRPADSATESKPPPVTAGGKGETVG